MFHLQQQKEKQKVKKINNNFALNELPAPLYDNVDVYKDSDFKLKETKQETEFDDDELDELAYEDAIEYDHRSLIRFFFSH